VTLSAIWERESSERLTIGAPVDAGIVHNDAYRRIGGEDLFDAGKVQPPSPDHQLGSARHHFFEALSFSHRR